MLDDVATVPGTNVRFGIVPVLGAFGDVAWRANRRNMRLLNRTIAEREQVWKATLLYWITAIAILVGMVALVVGATLWLIFAIVGALQ